MADKVVGGEKFVPNLPDVSVGKLLLDAMKSNADRIGHIVVSTGEQETYGHLRLRSVRLAQALVRSGVKPGDVISPVVRNTKDSLVLLAGILAMGAVANPLDVALAIDDMTCLLETSRPKFVFTERIAEEKIIIALKNFNSDARVVIMDENEEEGFFGHYQKPTGTEDEFEAADVGDTFESLAFLLSSSGSTGLPKTVMMTHAFVPRPFVQTMILDASDRVLTFTSMYWASGLYVIVCSCLAGALRILTLEPYSEELLFKYMKQYDVTRITLSSFFFGTMARHPLVKTADFSNIRDFWVTGGDVFPELLQEINDRLTNGFIRFCYGLTEAGACTVAEDKFCKPGSVGRLIPGYAAKIVDLDSNTLVGRNEQGELVVKPSFKVKGYYKNAQDTAELFDEDGWVKTGDVGYFDEDGFLFLVDRLKNILCTGHMVACSAHELEEVLYRHPAVKTAVVVGVKGQNMFDVPVAFVVLKPGRQVSEEELQKLVAGQLPDYKHLTGGVIFTEQLTMTPSGKFRTGELKKRAQVFYDKRCLV